jgi:hypothetical protein
VSRARGHISFKTKLVAALCQMRHEVDGRLELILNHDEAKALSEDQILSLFHWDHTVTPHAEEGADVHWNLAPELIVPHRVKTATVDVPGIAKRKRVATSYVEHTRTMATPRDQRPERKSKWASRPFPKRRKNDDTTGSRRHPQR